jgi:hypothetical protein
MGGFREGNGVVKKASDKVGLNEMGVKLAVP